MILTPEVIGRDLNAKVEKVMRMERKTWGDAVIFLISRVVSPDDAEAPVRKATNFFGRRVVSPLRRANPAA